VEDIPPIVGIDEEVEPHPGFVHNGRAARLDFVSFVVSLFLSSVVTICALSFVYLGQTNRLDTAISEARENQDISACRAAAASAVSSAQTDYLMAFGRGLAAFARGEDTDQVLEEIDRTAVILKKATDARARFEENPTGDC
jgi:hypothetical protein